MNYDYRKTAAYKARSASLQFSPRQSPKRKAWKPKQTKFPIEELHTRKGLIARTCPTCDKEFAIRACVIKNRKDKTLYKQTWCSDECYKKGRTEMKRYALKVTDHLKNKVKELRKKPGFYKSHKESYQQKIIPYKGSPTGKAYVGISKEPFMPAAENGYGYQGLLLQDDDRELIQCHGCGKWMQRISNLHLKSCSYLTTAQYKEKYGLNRDGGLVSDETSLRLTKNAVYMD